MLKSKTVRVFALCTLATTFVYYRYLAPRGDHFHLQFTDPINESQDLGATYTDIQTFLQVNREQTTLDKTQENIKTHKEVLSINKQISGSDTSKLEVNANVTGNRKINSPERFTNDVQKQKNYPTESENRNEIKKMYEENRIAVKNTKVQDLDFKIHNNKIYHKNETVPTKPIKFPVLRPSNGQFLKNIDLENYKPKDRKFLRDRKKTMLQRTKRIAKVCNDRSKLIVSRQLHLVWDRKHTPNVLYCPLYKVASTSWMINFLRLAHFNEDNPEILKLKPNKRKKAMLKGKYGAKQETAYEIYPPPTDREEFYDTLKSSLRVIIVRHPFTRILSAYRDKMTKLDPRPKEFHFRDLQLRIIAKYRPVDSPETSMFPTFPEFVQYLLDSTKTFVTAEDWLQKIHCWTPYWAKCNICGADYNVIMKLETIQEDEKFLITLANFEELKELKTQEWRHLHNSSSSDVAAEYYKQLSKLQIKQLHQRYIMDFYLFNYKIDDIFKNNDDVE